MASPHKPRESLVSNASSFHTAADYSTVSTGSPSKNQVDPDSTQYLEMDQPESSFNTVRSNDSQIPVQQLEFINPADSSTISHGPHVGHISFSTVNEPRTQRSRPSISTMGDEMDVFSGTLHGRRHRGSIQSGRSRHADADSSSSEVSERPDPLADADEFTIRERQEAINREHPFGLPLWKPALYKKMRSVEREANSTIHSPPSADLYISPGNVAWFLLFGWTTALVCLICSFLVVMLPHGGWQYGRTLRGLAWYLFWPFGRYMEKVGGARGGGADRWGDGVDQELREQWEQLERGRGSVMRSVYGEISDFDDVEEETGIIHTLGKLGVGGIAYYFLYFTVVAPMLLIISAVSFMMVFTVPMAKLNFGLVRYLRISPLALRFKRGTSFSTSRGTFRRPITGQVLLCTHNAAALKYYKYTYDGINIMFINLIPLVFFVLFTAHYLGPWTNHELYITKPRPIFMMCLASVIPLAYFIGMAVSSISAQSSLGVGAVINATFGSIVEIILFALALVEGKSELVEGSFIGNFLLGLLLLPGVSMLAGGIKRKEQRFNVKSAGVTSAVLILSAIGVFAPTLFHQIYGSCPNVQPSTRDCQTCYYDQLHPTLDPIFLGYTRPLIYICAILLPSAYIVALWFTLRTHVSHIYPEPGDQTRRLSLYQRLLSPQILQQLVPYLVGHEANNNNNNNNNSQHGTTGRGGLAPPPHLPAVSVDTSALGTADNSVIEMRPDSSAGPPGHGGHGGHDAPEWSNTKSIVILLLCTVLFSMIAENVDHVIKGFSIGEKFIGLTLFAIVPSITEFLNAIAFAVYGNVSLSLEICSAYIVQVAMLQIPALVAFNAWYNYGKNLKDIEHHSFNLLFPRWDVIAVVFSVFLITYTFMEGKSNYFKGSILIFAYLIFVGSFYFVPPM